MSLAVDENNLPSPSIGSSLSGEVRRLPAPWGWRFVQAITLWLLLVGVARGLGRLLLWYRHSFELRPDQRQLVLERRRTAWGRTLRSSHTVLPLERLAEVTLETRGESPAFSAGLAALVLGSFLGGRFFIEGARAPDGAPSLVVIAFALVLAGIALDFFLGSGRTPQHPSAHPRVILKTARQRGWVLTGMTEAEARSLVDSVEAALRTGDAISW